MCVAVERQYWVKPENTKRCYYYYYGHAQNESEPGNNILLLRAQIRAAKWRKTKGIITMIRSRHMSADNSWLLAADRSRDHVDNQGLFHRSG